jgi:hypothetical protein
MVAVHTVVLQVVESEVGGTVPRTMVAPLPGAPAKKLSPCTLRRKSVLFKVSEVMLAGEILLMNAPARMVTVPLPLCAGLSTLVAVTITWLPGEVDDGAAFGAV